MKWFWICCFVLLVSATGRAATPDQINKLYEFAQNDQSTKFELMWGEGGGGSGLYAKQYSFVEEISPMEKDEHMIGFVVIGTGDLTMEGKPIMLYAIVVDRLFITELLSPDTTQTEQWQVISSGDGGHADRTKRNYWLYVEHSGIIMPHYPEGFQNRQWDSPGQEEGQRVLDEAVDYWSKRWGLR